VQGLLGRLGMPRPLPIRDRAVRSLCLVDIWSPALRVTKNRFADRISTYTEESVISAQHPEIGSVVSAVKKNSPHSRRTMQAARSASSVPAAAALAASAISI